MNLLRIIQVYGYGTSEGVEKAWDTRGRGRHTPPPVSVRMRRAMLSYVPVTKEKHMLAKLNERRVAEAVRGWATANNHPFDVLSAARPIGVEVKTIVKGKNDKITMHPDSRRRKLEAAQRLGLKKLYTVAADFRKDTPVWYVKEGVGSYRLGHMTKLGDLHRLRQFIH